MPGIYWWQSQYFSNELLDELENTLARQEQAIILLLDVAIRPLFYVVMVL